MGNPKVSVDTLITQVVEAFKDPENLALTLAMANRLVTPSSRWTTSNQVLIGLAGTVDARSFQQWNDIERRVKKGSKAVYIVVPVVKKEDSKGKDNSAPTTVFNTVAKFRAEDTLGWNKDKGQWDDTPLEYELRMLPSLWGKSAEWGLQVNYTSHVEPGYFGSYAPETRKILLASESPVVFYHEIGHAAHHRICGDEFNSIEKWKKEAVAELAATVIAVLYEQDYPSPVKASYDYIAGAAEDGLSVSKLCMSVLRDVGRVLREIIGEPPGLQEAAA